MGRRDGGGDGEHWATCLALIPCARLQAAHDASGIDDW